MHVPIQNTDPNHQNHNSEDLQIIREKWENIKTKQVNVNIWDFFNMKKKIFGMNQCYTGENTLDTHNTSSPMPHPPHLLFSIEGIPLKGQVQLCISPTP